MNWLQRSLMRVVPREYVERIVAKAALTAFVRQYDAVRSPRYSHGWIRPSTSANAEVYGGLEILRNSSRELVRNNGLASKAIRILVNNTVGTGISVQTKTTNEDFNKKADALWKEFESESDFGDQIDFSGQQGLAIRSFLEGGETVIRKHIVSDKKLAVPLKLQMLEGDYIDHRRNERYTDGTATIQGIQVDRAGKRTGYHLYVEHPGESFFIARKGLETVLVPAADTLHLYELLRIGQMRGVPWLTAGMITARDGEGYKEAERVQKRIQACVAAIVLGADDPAQESITTTVQDSEGNKVEQFYPGLIAIARGGKDIKFTQPAVNNSYPDYIRSMVHDLSAAWNVTYEQLTGDLSQVNFSSIKAGLNEFRRSIEVLQWLTIIPMFLRPTRRWFMDIAIATGRLSLPDGMQMREAYTCDFTPPRFESIDPAVEVAGDRDAIRSMLLSPQEAIRRRGYDPEQVFKETVEWHKKLKSADFASDADAKLAPKAGSAKVGASAAESGDGAAGSADSADAARRLNGKGDHPAAN